MRLAVFAYHNIGYECLKLLIEMNENIVAVVTHEDDPFEEIWFRSVAEIARSHQLPVFTPRSPNTPEFINLMRRLAPDLIFSFYYRRLLSGELLAIPRMGGINLHGSLLPKYRGRSPVNWVLINGEEETGVTLHHMIEKADAGDIIGQKSVMITLEDTALTLYEKLTKAAVELLKQAYPLIRTERARRIPQDGIAATKFGGRRPEDGRVAWERSAREIYNLIRAVTHPFPGAFSFHGDKKFYIWEAKFVDRASSDNGQRAIVDGIPGTVEAVEKGQGMYVSTGDGKLLVTRAQFEGEKELPADELTVPVGSRLGS